MVRRISTVISLFVFPMQYQLCASASKKWRYVFTRRVNGTALKRYPAVNVTPQYWRGRARPIVKVK